MIQEAPSSLLNSHNLQITFYLSLTIAHLFFGLLHPESIVIAASGFAFFILLVLANMRAGTQEKI